MSIDWPSPVDGVVMQKKVIDGQMVKAGEEMFRLADLEHDLGHRRCGRAGHRPDQRSAPGHGAPSARCPAEHFEGQVTFVLHELEMATRTGKVRIEVANPEHQIKHEMFADVEIDAGAGRGRTAGGA